MRVLWIQNFGPNWIQIRIQGFGINLKKIFV